MILPEKTGRLQAALTVLFRPCCRRGNCKKASVGLQCEVGLRCRSYYVLCGSVLSVWNELEEVLTPVGGTNVKVQIVRLRTDDGQRIVGKLKARWTPEGSSSIRWCDLQPPLGSRGTPPQLPAAPGFCAFQRKFFCFDPTLKKCASCRGTRRC